MENLVDRLVRVLKLDTSVFGEIADDPQSTAPALLVTAGAGLIANLFGEGNFISRLLIGAIGALIGLAIWTAIVLLVSGLFNGQADYGSLLKVIGHAGAPYALAVIPVIGGIAGLVYSVVIQIRAVREVAQVSDGAAVGSVLIPLGILFVLGAILAVIALLTGAALLGGFLSGID